MPYYLKREYKLLGFRKSNAKQKKIYALLENKQTQKLVRVHFGSSLHQSYRNITGVYLPPSMIHGDSKRRKAYRARAVGKVKDGYYSPSFFSYHFYLPMLL